MRKGIIVLFILLNIRFLAAGSQYVDIQNSIVTVDFSKLGYKTITIDGINNDWTGSLPLSRNSEIYDSNEYIWYDAYKDDVGDGDYQYPYNTDFEDDSADIEQFRVCHDNNNVYVYIKCYNALNNIYRSAVVLGIDTGTPEKGGYDLIEGNSMDSALGCAAELRSTKIRCDYTIFSELKQKFWWTWNADSSKISTEVVHSGFYSFNSICAAGGGTIIIPPENGLSSVDLSKASNFNIWVYDTVGNNTLELNLKDITGEQEKHWSSASSVSNNWTLISIPLSNYKTVDLTCIKDIEIYEWNPGSYYFDDLSYDNITYHTFENSKSRMWDCNGTLYDIVCQPIGSKEWEITIPKNIVGDSSEKKWSFIAGAGFHENNMSREIQPLGDGNPLEWHGIGGDSLWRDNISPDPDVFDLIGASFEKQCEDFSSYRNLFTQSQSNLESLNIKFEPNPFNPEQEISIISFSVPMKCHITIKVLRLDGRGINKILDSTLLPPHGNDLCEINWDGKDENSQLFKSGVYILHVKYKISSQARDIYKFFKIWR